METFIKHLIENKKKRYSEDYSEMLGDYNREQETVKGYNGRQILELLQNCDDEGSKEVLITLDTTNKIISISNNGHSFSEKGYRSLFIANLSSKRSKRQYIGNKGLGFRSIINWSNKIEIHSNGIRLTYSEEIKKKKYNELFTTDIQKTIRNEESLSDDIIPMPFLCMPEVMKSELSDFITTIVIHYKEVCYNDILEQIEDITPETILFIKNIEQIKFKGIKSKNDIICTKEQINKEVLSFCPKQEIKFTESTWLIFSEEQMLPEEYADSTIAEKEFYQIKIATELSFKQSSPFLYSFFPTKIRLEQPYILHATFDLDSTRNQINESKKNEYILKKVVEFTILVAKYFAKNKVNYLPLEILNHKHKADTLGNLKYYNLIEKAIETEAVFPCIDNTYEKLEEVIYVSDGFAKMLQQIKAVEFICIHILPLDNKNLSEFKIEAKIDRSISVLEDVISVLNNIASLKLSIPDRALLISYIINECSFIKNEYPNQLNLLINDKLDIILGSEHIYTPVTLEQELMIPSFASIQFMNSQLFDELINVFKGNETLSRSRFIYDKLTGFCNIHSYEPTTVAQKIISETNNKIKGEIQEKSIEYIREMNVCLYNNFKRTNSLSKKNSLVGNIPTLSLNNQIKSTEEVSLSVFYPTGKRTSEIFNDIYKDENYVASPEYLGLNNQEEMQEIEAYLLWINVNKYVKYRLINTKSEQGDYLLYLKSLKGITSSTGYEIFYYSIDNFEMILSKMTLSKFIIWIYFDDFLKRQVDDIKNLDVYNNHFRGYYKVENKPSYIKYLIKQKYNIKFEEFLIDEKFSWANSFIINYNENIFVKNGITKSIINEILISLGAKDDFNNISIEKVANILNMLPHYYPDGKKTQSVYKKALTHYKLNNKILPTPIRLFADNGSSLKVYNHQEIYFSDRIKLPKKLKLEFPILNFPARAGGADAIKFFKIHDLKEIDIRLNSYLELEKLTKDFNKYFEKLKPIILTHRLNLIDQISLQKIQASICSKLKIIFCSELNFLVNQKEFQADEYEFLHQNEYLYFIKANQYDNLNSLRKNTSFTQAFADIISLSFDIVGEKSEFKSIIRNRYEDVLEETKNNFGDDTFQEARSLLGFADYKSAFWSAIFNAKGILIENPLDDISLEKLIKVHFQIDFDTYSIDYEKLSNEIELEKINVLFQDIDLSFSDFINEYSYKISLNKRHFHCLKTSILLKKNVIKSSIWNMLRKEGISLKAQFLNEINKYENCDNFISTKSQQFEYTFKINVEDIVIEYIELLYGKVELVENINLDEIKKRNISKFDKNQQFEIGQSERLKSLVYFEDSLETILSELSTSIQPDLISTESLAETILDVRMVSSEDLLPTYFHKTYSKTNNRVYTPKEKNYRILKQKGYISEQLVYNYLIINNYKNIYWASDDNDGLHYDIRYTNDSGVIKYVEVKSFDNGFFYLSKSEYEFGYENVEDYEIWLIVNREYIIQIKDFFKNPKYKREINEFIVYLELKNN